MILHFYPVISNSILTTHFKNILRFQDLTVFNGGLPVIKKYDLFFAYNLFIIKFNHFYTKPFEVKVHQIQTCQQ